jgi:CheY-like chemotaxis protein
MSATNEGAMTVLVVEDDLWEQKVLQAQLEARGFSVVIAEDGRQALKYLRQNRPPACIVLDLMMPVMDGWELRERQLADPTLAPIPVVITTALSEQGRHTPVLEGLPIIPKPFDLDRLADLVTSLCGRAPEPALAQPVGT